MSDLSKPLYHPHIDDPNVLHMGLQKIGPDQWLQADHEAGAFYRHKLHQFSIQADRVYQALPESRAAQSEFRSVLLDHLLHQHSSIYQRDGGSLVAPQLGLQWKLSGDENLWHSSLWIADDVCILQADNDDYRLVAASLCSPSQWYLGEKIGQSLSAIHTPIPGFGSQLTPKVSRFFSHLKVEHPVQRFNWSVQADQRLLWQDPDESILPASTDLYWRIERQTVRRLPKTSAIVFTIKVYIHPLEDLRKVSGGLSRLISAIDQCPEEISRYKDFDRIQLALEKYRK
jgi:hypothetical protein